MTDCIYFYFTGRSFSIDRIRKSNGSKILLRSSAGIDHLLELWINVGNDACNDKDEDNRGNNDSDDKPGTSGHGTVAIEMQGGKVQGSNGHCVCGDRITSRRCRLACRGRRVVVVVTGRSSNASSCLTQAGKERRTARACSRGPQQAFTVRLTGDNRTAAGWNGTGVKGVTLGNAIVVEICACWTRGASGNQSNEQTHQHENNSTHRKGKALEIQPRGNCQIMYLFSRQIQL